MFQVAYFSANERDKSIKLQDKLRKELFSGLKLNTFVWKNETSGIFNLHISRNGGALPHSHPQALNVIFNLNCSS